MIRASHGVSLNVTPGSQHELSPACEEIFLKKSFTRSPVRKTASVVHTEILNFFLLQDEDLENRRFTIKIERLNEDIESMQAQLTHCQKTKEICIAELEKYCELHGLL